MNRCPICTKFLGEIDKGDETEFYCNRCKINSISFPEPNAYDKFCEHIKNNQEIIINLKHESSKISKKQDFVENLFGHSTSEEIPKIKKIPKSPTVRKIMNRLGQDSEQINEKLLQSKISKSELPDWFLKFLYPNDSDVSWISYIKKFPATQAEFDESFEIMLNSKIKNILEQKGITDLYKYQKLAFNSIVNDGRNTVVTAPTASGKTEAMIIPILNKILSNPDHQGVFAVMVYPTKALAADQFEKIKKYTEPCGISIEKLDGDTPETQREKIISNPPKILVTNFDIIHIHLWKQKKLADLLKNTKILGIDEIHKYDGVFGSNIHHIIARLKRVSKITQIIGATATLDNAKEFCEKLFNSKINLIEGKGKQSNRYFVILELTSESKYQDHAISILETLKENDLQTIIFNNSRSDAEEVYILGRDYGYNVKLHRAGLEPEYRKKIETELKNGNFDAISSTPTLELGIDIGALDAVITPFAPYNSLMQRIGRAGRGGQDAFAFMILDGRDPVQHYYLNHPQKIFEDNRFVNSDPNNEHLKLIHTLYKSKDRSLDENEINEKAAKKLKDEHVFDSPLENNPHKKSGYIANSKYDFLLQKFNIRDMGLDVKIIKNETEEIESWPIPMAFRKLHYHAIYLSQGKTFEVIEEKLLDDRNPTVKIVSRTGQSPIGCMNNEWENLRTTAQISKQPLKKNLLEKTSVMKLPVELCDLDIIGFISSFTYRNKNNEDIDFNPVTGKPIKSIIRPLEGHKLVFKLKTMGIVIDLSTFYDDMKLFDPEHFDPDIIEKRGTENLWFSSVHSLEHLLVHSCHMIAGGIMNNLDGHFDVENKILYIFDESTSGGNGASKASFPKLEEIFARARDIIETCDCMDGCPKCVEKLKCESYNASLSKKGAKKIFKKLFN